MTIKNREIESLRSEVEENMKMWVPHPISQWKKKKQKMGKKKKNTRKKI